MAEGGGQTWSWEPGLATEQRRLYSSIIAQYPWESECIALQPASLVTFAGRIPAYRRFIESLHNFETHLFQIGWGLSGYNTLNLLGIYLDFEPGDEVPRVVSRHIDPLSPAEFHDIASVITAYRLFERLALRANLVHRVPSPSPYTKLYLPSSKTKVQEHFHGLSKMADWIQVLFDFRKTLMKMTVADDNLDPLKPSNSLVALLRLVRKSNAKSAYHAIESNFLYAALQLNVMRNVGFQKEQVPDLPKDVHKSTYPIFSDPDIMSAVCTEDFAAENCSNPELILDELRRTTGVDSGILMLRAALQLALLISPLYLLLAFQLVKKSFHRRAMLELAANLGPDKPPLLIQVENKIFDALDTLSMGQAAPRQTLGNLSAGLPWEELENASQNPKVFGWFARHSAQDEQIQRSSEFTAPLNASDYDNVSTINENHQLQPPEPKEPKTNQPVGTYLYSPFTKSKAHLCIKLGSDSSVSQETGVVAPDFALPPLLPVSSPSLCMAVTLPEFLGDNMDWAGDMNAVSLLPNHSLDGSPISGNAPECITVANQQSSLALSELIDPPFFDVDQTLQDFQMELLQAETETAASDLSELTQSSKEGETSELSSQEYYSDSDHETGVTQPPPAANEDTMPSTANLDKIPGSKKPSRDKGSKGTLKGKGSGSASKSKGSGSASKSKGSKPAANGVIITKASNKRKDLKPAKSPIAMPDPTLAKAGNTSDKPIDVDDYVSLFEPAVVRDYVKLEPISLPATPAPRRFRSPKAYTIYAADGTSRSLQLESHSKAYITRFQNFMNKAALFCIEDKPRFLKAPDQSFFGISEYKDFIDLPAPEKQQLLARRCIVVQHWPCDPKLRFNAEGLYRLAGSLSRQISLHDTSQPVQSGKCLSTVVSGRVQDLLDNATPNGKILNGLDFSMFRGELADEDYATDVVAWSSTRGRYHTHATADFPIGHTLWGLAGHQHCFTFIHVDAEGFHTKNLVEDGGKAWGILGEVRNRNPSEALPFKLSSIHFFVNPTFQTSNMDKLLNDYEVEVIFLRRGDMLFMPPGTPHFVITTDHSVCLGGHFYSTAAMQYTLQGLIHTFVLDTYLTNTEHPPSRSLLRRILIFYYQGLIRGEAFPYGPTGTHLPDVHDIDGLLNLLSACILNVLGNVLDFRTYRAPTQKSDITVKPTQEQRVLVEDFDHNAIPMNERESICSARGVALHIMDWVRSFATVKSRTGKVFVDLPSFFFIQIVRSLLNYRDLAEAAKLPGVPGCTKKLLESQVMNAVNSDSRFRAMWAKRYQIPSTSLEFEDKSNYTVTWQDRWRSVWDSAEVDFLELGKTALDRAFFSTQKERRVIESTDVIRKLKAALMDNDKHVHKRARHI